MRHVFLVVNAARKKGNVSVYRFRSTRSVRSSSLVMRVRKVFDQSIMYVCVCIAKLFQRITCTCVINVSQRASVTKSCKSVERFFLFYFFFFLSFLRDCQFNKLQGRIYRALVYQKFDTFSTDIRIYRIKNYIIEIGHYRKIILAICTKSRRYRKIEQRKINLLISEIYINIIYRIPQRILSFKEFSLNLNKFSFLSYNFISFDPTIQYSLRQNNCGLRVRELRAVIMQTKRIINEPNHSKQLLSRRVF